jgi:hypothetical protein
VILYLIAFYVLCASLFPAFAQPLPDSLVARVVLLEKIAYDPVTQNGHLPSYPQANGFFMSFGNSGLRYLVTAKHAFCRPDTVAATQIHVLS